MTTPTLKPFQPHPLLSNCHLQTIGVNLWHDLTGITFARHRLGTEDGDFLDLDVPTVKGLPIPAAAPTVLVIHGLGGDARGSLILAAYREMARVGIRTVGLNLRGCSGEPNRLARSYHLGATEDLPLVLNWVQQQFPGLVGLMGYSLGANLTLKLTGEMGAAMSGLIQTAIAVSPPFVLGNLPFDRFPNQIYRRYLLASLRKQAAPKAALINAAGGDAQATLQARTFEAYDNAYTAPVNGFANADDYYQKVASGQFVAGIRIPTLVIRAVDDPFFNHDIPDETLAANPAITALISAHGGHCGFFEGLGRRPWAQMTAAAWMLAQLR